MCKCYGISYFNCCRARHWIGLIHHPWMRVLRPGPPSAIDMFLPISFPLPDGDFSLVVPHGERGVSFSGKKLQGHSITEFLRQDSARVFGAVTPFQKKCNGMAVVQRSHLQVRHRDAAVPERVQRDAKRWSSVPGSGKRIVERQLASCPGRKEQAAGGHGSSITASRFAKRFDVVRQLPSLHLTQAWTH